MRLGPITSSRHSKHLPAGQGKPASFPPPRFLQEQRPDCSRGRNRGPTGSPLLLEPPRVAGNAPGEPSPLGAAPGPESSPQSQPSSPPPLTSPQRPAACTPAQACAKERGRLSRPPHLPQVPAWALALDHQRSGPPVHPHRPQASGLLGNSTEMRGSVGSREGLSWPGPPAHQLVGLGRLLLSGGDVTPGVGQKRRQELTAARVHVCKCPTRRHGAGLPAERSRASDSKSSDLSYSGGSPQPPGRIRPRRGAGQAFRPHPKLLGDGG